jgi:hypothetical protein
MSLQISKVALLGGMESGSEEKKMVPSVSFEKASNLDPSSLFRLQQKLFLGHSSLF